jgi:hypothetical protein
MGDQLTANFSGKGFQKNWLELMAMREQFKKCCQSWLTQVYTTNSSSIIFSGLGTQASPLTAVVNGSSSGFLLGADDGLSVVGSNAVLGGVTLTNKVVDLSVNNNVMWFKESLAPAAYSQFIVGGASGGTTPGSVWGFPHPAILVSKSITSDGNNSVFMEMSNPDAPAGSSYNGFLILNYQNVAGQVQPNIRAASNALAGQGGAFNLDLAGRDSYNVAGNNYSHFSIWYYDYEQYFYTNPGAPGPMLNSDFLNFNNGQGGGVGSTRFFMIDKHYNTLLGKATWNARPAATLDIQDNGSGQTGIYQRGATSPNWFAGNTVIGGPLPTIFGTTYQLTVSGNTQITQILDLYGLVSPFDPDGVGPGMITANGQPFLHLGANSGNEQFSLYIGLHAGQAVRASNTAVIESAVAIGYGALQSISGTQQFDGVAIGTGCGQSLTTASAVVAIGWATANSSTTLNNSVLIGPIAGSEVNGSDNTFIGTGAGGAASISGPFNGTVLASGSTLVGAFAASQLSNVTVDNIIILGSFSSKTTNSVGVWNNTTIIGNSMTTNLNNIAMFGSATQDILVGFTTGATDNGYRLQINGGLTLATTTLPGVVVNGALETDGTHLYFSVGGVRHTIV